MKTGINFSPGELELMKVALNELSTEITHITGVEVSKKEALKRRFVFGPEKMFKEVSFGFRVNRESILEFEIEARLSKPCDKPECFFERLKEIFDKEEILRFQLPDTVSVAYNCCINIDDCDFDRMLKCLRDGILEKFVSTYNLANNN
jgi:hypothetical protein